MKENEQEKQEREHGQGRVMQMTFEIGGRGKATIGFPMLGAYSSPTSPGSAPADTASTLLYQHSDHLTTRFTTDNAGTLSNQQAHYPYGENWYATGTADPSVNRKFTSYRKEGGSLASGQINYAIARYHGARIGRFHRPDPVRGNFRNPQRLNRYAYVTNNPVRYTDPRGLDMSDGIGPEWQCPNGPGSCVVAPGAGLIENPNASGGGNMGYNVFDAIAAGDFSLANQLAAGNNPTLNYINQQNGYTDWINQIPVDSIPLDSPLYVSGGAGGQSTYPQQQACANELREYAFAQFGLENFATSYSYAGGTTFQVTFNSCAAVNNHLQSLPGFGNSGGSWRHTENPSLEVSLPRGAGANLSPCSGEMDFDRFAPNGGPLSLLGHAAEVLWNFVSGGSTNPCAIRDNLRSQGRIP